jgi:predicted flap endonuclease-1-like 5' DNA nuclease
MATDTSLPPYRLTVVTYALLATILVACLVLRATMTLAFDTRIPADAVRVAQVERRIDPNSASPAELATLPGIGEALAGRIVTYRDEQAALLPPGEPVFRSPDDLEPVKGIGPRLIERMTPHLRFAAEAESEKTRRRD